MLSAIFVYTDMEFGHFVYTDMEFGHFVYTDMEVGHFVNTYMEVGHFVYLYRYGGTDVLCRHVHSSSGYERKGKNELVVTERGEVLTTGLVGIICSLICNGRTSIGECEPCDKVAEQSCVCGRSVEQRPCNSPSWYCTKVRRQVNLGEAETPLNSFYFCAITCSLVESLCPVVTMSARRLVVTLLEEGRG